MTSKIVSLKAIKESSSNGRVYPSEKKQIAWAGGKITTNKQKTALKFIEKKKQSGEELTEQEKNWIKLILGEKGTTTPIVKESTPQNRTIKIKVAEPDFSHRFSDSSSSIDSLLSSEPTSSKLSVFSRLNRTSSSKSESTLNSIFSTINTSPLKISKDMNLSITINSGKQTVSTKPLGKSPIKIKQPSPNPASIIDKGKPVLTEKLGSFLERHTLEGVTKPTKRSYQYDDDEDQTVKRIHYLGPKKTVTKEKSKKINFNIAPVYIK